MLKMMMLRKTIALRRLLVMLQQILILTLPLSQRKVPIHALYRPARRGLAQSLISTLITLNYGNDLDCLQD